MPSDAPPWDSVEVVSLPQDGADSLPAFQRAVEAADLRHIESKAALRAQFSNRHEWRKWFARNRRKS